VGSTPMTIRRGCDGLVDPHPRAAVTLHISFHVTSLTDLRRWPRSAPTKAAQTRTSRRERRKSARSADCGLAGPPAGEGRILPQSRPGGPAPSSHRAEALRSPWDRAAGPVASRGDRRLAATGLHSDATSRSHPPFDGFPDPGWIPGRQRVEGSRAVPIPALAGPPRPGCHGVCPLSRLPSRAAPETGRAP
jgi:hypothetical protein